MSKQDLAELTTIIQTSPAPAHPSTRLLEEVVSSLALAGLSPLNHRVIVIADGCKRRERSRWKKGEVDELAEAAYERYLARVLAGARRPGCALHGIELVCLQERHGCAHALRRALSLVATRCVFVCQHDRVLQNEAPVLLVANVVLTAAHVNAVNLSTITTVTAFHSRFGLSALLFKPQTVLGLRLVPLPAFRDSNYVARTDWLRDAVFGPLRGCALPRGAYLEDTFGQAQLAAVKRGGAEALARYGTFVLVDSEAATVRHLNGRDLLAASGLWRKYAHSNAQTDEAEWERAEAAGETPQPPRLEGFQ